jgi:hypothetical protein
MYLQTGLDAAAVTRYQQFESFISRWYTLQYQSSRNDFFETPPAEENAVTLWDQAEYERQLESTDLSNLRTEGCLRKSLNVVGFASIVAIVAGLVISNLTLALIAAAVLVVIIPCTACCYSTSRFVIKGQPFLEQVQLRTQKVWAEGMTAANWPPHLCVLPENAEQREETLKRFESVKTVPLNMQNRLWQNYKLSDKRTAEQNQDLLFEMTRGNWGNAKAKEFVDDLLKATTFVTEIEDVMRAEGSVPDNV